MWIINTILRLLRLSYDILTHLIITINRWVAFTIHLAMTFFMWNSLLVIIGLLQTVQITVRFGYDVSSLTAASSTKKSPPESDKISSLDEEKEEKLEKPPTFWQKRRKIYQEMVDNLYIKYMDRLVELQQDQARYWQFNQNNYIYPQSRYYYYEDENLYQENIIEDNNGETNSDDSGGSVDNNQLFIPPIKITEDTSTAVF